MATFDLVAQFVLENQSSRAPARVRRDAKRSLLDLIGVAIAGTTTESSRIARETAVELWPPGFKTATLAFDGRRASAPGAAFAGAQTIDSFDAHDGFNLAKGHAGVAILPGLLAVAESEEVELDGRQFLDLLIAGYEIACRAAVALHATCADYHASGAWNALGVAAVAGRLLGLSADQLRESLGIAEYYGPRAQIMRVVDHPSMVKDGSGWGAMAGVTAAYLARRNFTGAPALTIESPAATSPWADLGENWLMSRQYMKPWPTCRWAQPAVEAALALYAAHDLQHADVATVEIHTFHEACRLAGPAPRSTDEAQYSIAWPTACALARGRVGLEEVSGSLLDDPRLADLARRVRFVESPEFNALFPRRRHACLVVELGDGRRLEKTVAELSGDADWPMSDGQVVDKFFALAEPLVGAAADQIHAAVGNFDDPDVDFPSLLRLTRATQVATCAASL